MKSVYLVLSSLLVFSFTMRSVGVSVNGHLRSRSHKGVDGIYVFVKGALDGYILYTHTVTDKKGYFHLECNTGSESDLAFYYVNRSKDTILLKRVHNMPESSEVTWWIK